MKEVKNAVNKGREYNGEKHKLEKCKIAEINNILINSNFNMIVLVVNVGMAAHPPLML